MRKLTKEAANGAVSETAAFEAQRYAKSGRFSGYFEPPARLVTGSSMMTGRFAAFRQGCVSVVGPKGRLPQ